MQQLFTKQLFTLALWRVAQQPIAVIYGCISSGTQWRFLQLEGETVTIDLMDYPLPPVEQILGILVWMVQNG